MDDNKKYTINISYQTGDSFGSEDCEETIEHVFSLDIAKKNLQRIKEHYEFYQKIKNGRLSKKERDELLKSKPEFYNEKHPFCLELLLDDNGNTISMVCFWIGYFERLYGAEIILVENTDGMSFRI